MSRRRGRAALVLVAGTALLMTTGGCAAVAGDGDLLDDWGPVAAARWNVPPVGTCYDTAPLLPEQVPETPHQTTCDKGHTVETFHVGEVPAATATGRLPVVGASSFRLVHAECEKAAREFLGDDWWLGRLALRAVLPRHVQWESGARHYRCDLMEIQRQGGKVVERTATLRDGLRAGRPVATTCYLMDKPDNVKESEYTPADCAQPHDAQFAGVFEPAEGEMPAGATQRTMGLDGCQTVVRGYLGASGALRVNYMYWGFGMPRWRSGDRRVHCYVLSPQPGKKLKGSVKGLGNAMPPLA